MHCSGSVQSSPLRQAHYDEAMRKLADTQCNEAGDGPAPGGYRQNHPTWPLLAGETNINTEGGLCGMPSQFLGTVRVGGKHRVTRWCAIAQEQFTQRVPEYNAHQECRVQSKM